MTTTTNTNEATETTEQLEEVYPCCERPINQDDPFLRCHSCESNDFV